jgi:hypothetical protein
MVPSLVKRMDLVDAFNFVKSVIPLKPIIEADANVTLSSDGKTFTLTASDGIIGAKAVIPLSNADKSPEPFSVGCDPKRFGKAIQKDTADEISIAKVGFQLHVLDPQESEDKFVTLSLGNMRRATVITRWEPAEDKRLNNVEINAEILAEAFSFLNKFTPEGKEGFGKHDVVVLGKHLAHTTNGVNLRGIFASKAFTFDSEVSIQKGHLVALSKSLACLKNEMMVFKNSSVVVGIHNKDMTRCITAPTLVKAPPVVPSEYLASKGEPLLVDIKALTKGLDRLSTSNYNTLSTLTGVDLIVSGEASNSKLQLILDEGKASQSFPATREGNQTLEKTSDVATLLMVLKAFAKGSNATKLFLGDASSKYMRLVDIKEVGGAVNAYIAICSYARKV